MGKLIWNHWARLVCLLAATVQIGGSIEGFIWPKITWDFTTSALNILVKPVPILQIINLVLGLIVLAWEWPLGFLAGKIFHRSIHARLVMFTLCAFFSLSLYQSHSSTIYYLLGMYGYALALSNHEIIHKEPWTVPHIDEATIPKIQIDDAEKPEPRRQSTRFSEYRHHPKRTTSQYSVSSQYSTTNSPPFPSSRPVSQFSFDDPAPNCTSAHPFGEPLSIYGAALPPTPSNYGPIAPPNIPNVKYPDHFPRSPELMFDVSHHLPQSPLPQSPIPQVPIYTRFTAEPESYESYSPISVPRPISQHFPPVRDCKFDVNSYVPSPLSLPTKRSPSPRAAGMRPPVLTIKTPPQPSGTFEEVKESDRGGWIRGGTG